MSLCKFSSDPAMDRHRWISFRFGPIVGISGDDDNPSAIT